MAGAILEKGTGSSIEPVPKKPPDTVTEPVVVRSPLETLSMPIDPVAQLGVDTIVSKTTDYYNEQAAGLKAGQRLFSNQETLLMGQALLHETYSTLQENGAQLPPSSRNFNKDLQVLQSYLRRNGYHFDMAPVPLGPDIGTAIGVTLFKLEGTREFNPAELKVAGLETEIAKIGPVKMETVTKTHFVSFEMDRMNPNRQGEIPGGFSTIDQSGQTRVFILKDGIEKGAAEEGTTFERYQKDVETNEGAHYVFDKLVGNREQHGTTLTGITVQGTPINVTQIDEAFSDLLTIQGTERFADEFKRIMTATNPGYLYSKSLMSQAYSEMADPQSGVLSAVMIKRDPESLYNYMKDGRANIERAREIAAKHYEQGTVPVIKQLRARPENSPE